MHAPDHKIVSILKETGPLTGGELARRSLIDLFTLWQICRKSAGVQCRIAGRRFLRLDRFVEGYARLSPSIGREFQTYTVVGAAGQGGALEETARRLGEEIGEISRAKFGLARETMASVLGSLPEREAITEGACFILAGDITYRMAHRDPRPEKSTGKTVRGSDLDIVVVAGDGLDQAAIASLDRAIHDRKYLLLVHPRYREEIDYLIKTVSRVRAQLRLETFESMVAGKILNEGLFLCGNPRIFQMVKQMIREEGLPDKFGELTVQARRNREQAEDYLLKLQSDLAAPEYRDLFHTREESLEGLY
ncbi:MAG: hypothetical protein V1789_03910 [PVC group bacterium]